MPVAPFHGVTVLRIAHLHFAQQLRERLGAVGQQHQVDMIRHQAVAQHVDGAEFGVLLQQAEVYIAVGGGEENITSLVAALGDVMGIVGDDHACKSRHAELVGIRLEGYQ